MSRFSRRALLIVASLAATSVAAEGVHLADGPLGPEQSPGGSLIEDGGYFEIGVGVEVARSSSARSDPADEGDTKADAALFIDGAWRRGRLFFEGRRGGLEGVGLGATLWHDDTYVLDLLGAHLAGTVNIDLSLSDDPVETDDAERDARLLDRDSGVVSSGLRLRRYSGPTLLQLSVVMDWRNGNGVLSGAHAGRQWQLGNWSAEGIVGVRHAGADLLDFVYGVDAEEATARFPAYEGRSGWFVEADVTVTRPLTQHWLFRSGVRARRFGEAITDSPLVVERGNFSAEAAVSYVF